MGKMTKQLFHQAAFVNRKLQQLFKVFMQVHMGVQRLFVFAAVLKIAAVRQHLPRVLVVHADCIDKTLDIATRIRRFNFGEHLNAAAGIAVDAGHRSP